MEKNIKQAVYGILFLVMAISCTYHNEEELYGNKPGDACNTENATYATDVLPVLQSNCYGCHKSDFASGGVNLEGYDQVKIYVNNGRLLGAINHLPGFSPMPKGGTKLPACDIEKIQKWIDAGAPNN